MTESPGNPEAAPSRTDNKERMIRAAGGGTPSIDVDLLVRVKADDQVAMTELFERYGGMVYSVALRVLNDQGQAEDVMQEIFFQVWRNPDSFVSGRGSLGAWLAVMARNRAIDSLRRRRPTDSVDDVVLASKTDFAADIERNRMMEKVRRVIKDLPAEQQRSVEMAFFEGLSHSEIAAQTGDPLGTVKTRIRSALMTLRKAITA
jgi:RNA polymerase sigma-70 factor (ECF subfamily)